ncbi:hypothetical protein QJQ45_024376, partial [Haematococcus lacustris]
PAPPPPPRAPPPPPPPPAQLARLEAEVLSLRSRLEVEQKLRAQLLSENEALDARLRGLTRLLLPGSGAGGGAGGRGGPGAAAAGIPGLTGSWAGAAGGEGEGHAGRRSPGGRTPRSHRRAEGLGQQRHSCDDPLDLSCDGQDLPVLIRSSTPIAPHHLLPDQELHPDPDQPQQAAQTLVEATSKAYPAGNATTSCQSPGDPTDEEAAEQLLLDQIADLQCDVQGDLTQGGGLGGGYSRSLHSSGTGLLAGSQGSGGAVARASSVRTGASGSLMGDGDKDFEIQVLLADREVLQDQIVGVELSNEALKAERELLLAEVDRLKLEHEKERRIVKELESDMMELRNFKNATQAELDALHSQLDCAQRRSPSSSCSPSPSTAPPSSLQAPTRSPSLAWAASPPAPFSPLLAHSSPSPSHSHSPLLPLSPMATPDPNHPNCPTALEAALQLPAGALLQPGSAAQQEGRAGPVAAAGVEAAGWRQLRADVASGAAPAPQLMARLEALEGHVLNAINIALARNRSLEEVVAEQQQQLQVLQAAHQQLLLQNKRLTEQNQQLQASRKWHGRGFGVEVLSPGQRSQLVGSITAAARRPHGSGSMIVQSDEADSDSEDEEEVGSRQAAADMETTFGENEEEEEEGSELGSEPVQLYAIPPKGRRAALVPACEFQQHVDSAKQELAAIADAVVRDLHNRFLPPEHAKGLAVVYAHYWDKQPSDEDFLERLAILNTVLSSAAANPAKEPTTLWRYLAGQPITKAHILEYIKLAELALVMTPGSVEEERMFSAMAYLKDDTRNRLIWTHYQMSVPLASGWITLLCVGATRL